MDTVKRGNALILLDTLHFYRSRVTLDELKSTPKKLFRTVHICDAAKRYRRIRRASSILAGRNGSIPERRDRYCRNS